MRAIIDNIYAADGAEYLFLEMFEPSAVTIITDHKTSGQVFSFSLYIWHVSFVRNFHKNWHNQLKQNQSGKQHRMLDLIWEIIRNLSAHNNHNIYEIADSCHNPKSKTSLSNQHISFVREGFQKKTYKLRLLAQPKVGRCPEGV